MKNALLLLALLLVSSSQPMNAQDPSGAVTTLQAPDGTTVVIYRDNYGVPHIRGASETGVFYGQGYAVAQDRLFQLEVFRRAAKGQLSQVGLGPVSSDKLTRTLFYTEAERVRQLERLSPTIRNIIQSYVAGINAYLAVVGRQPQALLPVQFFARGFTPQPWIETDVVAIIPFFMRRFWTRGGQELTRLVELQAYGRDWFERNRPINDPDAPTTIPEEALSQARTAVQGHTAALRGHTAALTSPSALSVRPEIVAAINTQVQEQEAEFAELGIPPKFGSFAVLVDGSKSSTGNVMLLGAPQTTPPRLDLRTFMPNDVHEVELDCPTLHIAGMTIAGMPGVVIGHTNHFAWTATSGNSDNIDTFIETLSPDGTQYLHEERYLDLEEIEEPDLGFSHYRTVHGPVIGMDPAGGQAFSWQMTFWDQEMEMVELFYAMWKAETLEQFEAAALRMPVNPNLFYAGKDQQIKYWHLGKLLRHHQIWGSPADGPDPRLPRLGDGTQEWGDDPFLSPAELPHFTDPAQGYILDWNTKPASTWNNGDHIAWTLQFEPTPYDDDAEKPRAARTLRVLKIDDYVRPLAALTFEDLKDVSQRIDTTGTYQQAIEVSLTGFRDQNIVPPGQSGFVGLLSGPSPHFSDQWPLHRAWAYKDMVVNTPLRAWPPDHQYRRIDIAEFVDPAFRETAYITSVWSDEPEEAGEDGETTGDIVVQDCRTVLLRAERAGDGNGRVYTIHAAAPDPAGNAGTAALFQVQVPLSQGADAVVLDDGPAYEVKSDCSAGSAVAEHGLSASETQGGSIALALEGNYPNPFGDATEISFALPHGSRVVLSVYNMLGQEVARLVDGYREAGRHQVTFDGRGLSAGVYLCRLQAGEAQFTRKMMLTQ